MNLPDIETVSARVHQRWMETKTAKGVSTRVSETGEELMVPYDQLSDPAKELDRQTVRAVYEAISDLASAITIPPEILYERKRQIEVEGFDGDHDYDHANGELLSAAVTYYLNATQPDVIVSEPGAEPIGWPWDKKWWKPKSKRRDLVRAGALCLAERDRLIEYSAESYTGHVEQKLRLIIDALAALPGDAPRRAVSDGLLGPGN